MKSIFGGLKIYYYISKNSKLLRMSDNVIRELIQDLASDNDLSLRQLAFRSGMSAQTINSLRNRKNPSIKSLKRLFNSAGEQFIITRKSKGKTKKYILNG